MLVCSFSQAVEPTSPAFESGLRPGDLITHVNNEPIQGLLHTQVVQLILSGGSKLTLRSLPLESTSIKMGGRKRNPQSSKMTRHSIRKKHQRERSGGDKKRRTSLFRRLSNKKAHEQHIMPSGGAPLTPSRSFGSLNRSLSSGDSLPCSPTRSKSPKSPPLARTWTSPNDSTHSTSNSSQSSSPSSSVPNSPASSSSLGRPSSLHGLKHKLAQNINKSPHRRKSVHNIPLSPLARTPSPSPMATSPTRSPSPLTVVTSHQGAALREHAHSHSHSHTPGISNMVQTYHSPSQTLTPVPLKNTTRPKSGDTSVSKRGIGRPKSCEPRSPLLRRALSPDRLHPSSAEKPPTHHRKSSWQEKTDVFDSL